jgi:hypothetical protein
MRGISRMSGKIRFGAVVALSAIMTALTVGLRAQTGGADSRLLTNSVSAARNGSAVPTATPTSVAGCPAGYRALVLTNDCSEQVYIGEVTNPPPGGTTTCKQNSDCNPSGKVNCVVAPFATPTPTGFPTPVGSCEATCNTDSDCPGPNMSCVPGFYDLKYSAKSHKPILKQVGRCFFSEITPTPLSTPVPSNAWSLAANGGQSVICVQNSGSSNASEPGQSCQDNDDCKSGACILPATGDFCTTSQSGCVCSDILSWGGNVWARTGCSGAADSLSCETGDCGQNPGGDCNYTGGAPPVTLAEFSLKPNFVGQAAPRDFYDVSQVSGMNVGVEMSPLPDSFQSIPASGLCRYVPMPPEQQASGTELCTSSQNSWCQADGNCGCQTDSDCPQWAPFCGHAMQACRDGDPTCLKKECYTAPPPKGKSGIPPGNECGACTTDTTCTSYATSNTNGDPDATHGMGYCKCTTDADCADVFSPSGAGTLCETGNDFGNVGRCIEQPYQCGGPGAGVSSSAAEPSLPLAYPNVAKSGCAWDILTEDSPDYCPPELQKTDKAGKVVGCYSPNKAWGLNSPPSSLNCSGTVPFLCETNSDCPAGRKAKAQTMTCTTVAGQNFGECVCSSNSDCPNGFDCTTGNDGNQTCTPKSGTNDTWSDLYGCSGGSFWGTSGFTDVPANQIWTGIVCGCPDWSPSKTAGGGCQSNSYDWAVAPVGWSAPTGSATATPTAVPTPYLSNQTYYSRFKETCPTAYSYAFDDETSTYTCQSGLNGVGPSYNITFCPQQGNPNPTASATPTSTATPVADADLNGNCDRHRKPNGNRNCDCNGNSYGDSDSYCDRHGDHDGNRDSDRDSHEHRDCH